MGIENKVTMFSSFLSYHLFIPSSDLNNSSSLSFPWFSRYSNTEAGKKIFIFNAVYMVH